MPPRFANDTERDLSRMLDFHGIAWEYEPHTFVLEAGPDGERARRVHARLLPARAGSLHRGHHDEAVARHEEEPQDAAAARALPGRAHQDASTGATSRRSPTATNWRGRHDRRRRARGRTAPGEVYLPAELLAARVAELAAAIDRDHRGTPLVLRGRAEGRGRVRCADLSRALIDPPPARHDGALGLPGAEQAQRPDPAAEGPRPSRARRARGRRRGRGRHGPHACTT